MDEIFWKGGNGGKNGKSWKSSVFSNQFSVLDNIAVLVVLVSLDVLDGMDGNDEAVGKNGKLWKIEKSRNAFGTACRPDGRLLLCDGAALRLPFGVTMSFAAVGTARFAIAQLVLQNHREHDMVPFGREHFVVLEHFVVAFFGRWTGHAPCTARKDGQGTPCPYNSRRSRRTRSSRKDGQGTR